MDELIRKDNALEICDRWRRRANSVHDRDGFYIANVIYEQMKELGDARPQGEWIEIGTISHSYKCSVCGRTLFHITVGKNHVAKYYPYCHCGARMKGADNE